MSSTEDSELSTASVRKASEDQEGLKESFSDAVATSVDQFKDMSISEMQHLVLSGAEEAGPAAINKLKSLGVLDIDVDGRVQALSSIIPELDEETCGPIAQVAAFLGPFLKIGAQDLAKKCPKNPDAWSHEGGKEFAERASYFRRILSVHRWLSSIPPCVAAMICLLSTVLSAWVFPIALICVREKTGQLVSPLQNFRSFGIAMMMLWLAECCAPFFTLFPAIFVMRNSGAEVIGSLYRRLDSFYAPQPEKFNEEELRAKRAPLTHVVNQVNSVSKKIFIMCVVIVVLVVVVTGAYYTGIKFARDGSAYWIIHMVLLWIVAFMTIFSLFAMMVLVVTATDLMAANIKAYGDLLNLLCMQVTLLYDQEIAVMVQDMKEKKEGNKEQDKEQEAAVVVAMSRVSLHPAVSSLHEQLRSYEAYIESVSKVLKQTGGQVNFVYACFALVYFFMLFYIYITFIEARAGGTEGKTGAIVAAAAFAFGVSVSLFPVAYPLVHMAQQAQAWVTLTKPLNKADRQIVSSILSPKQDPFYLVEHHSKLQEKFTCEILGFPIMYSTIASSITGYLTVVFVSVVWPAIQDYVENLKNQIESQIEQLE